MTDTFRAKYISEDFSIENFNHTEWNNAQPIYITKYWSGEEAPDHRHAKALALWSDKFLYVRFDCNQTESLVIKDKPQTKRKADKLWERDVCEIFIAPNENEPGRYFEFEVAPTGEWLDLAIYQKMDGRETDWQYESKMIASAKIEEQGVKMVIRIPFSSLDFQSESNMRKRVNLFRCIGSGAMRGYLAWQPTLTQQPNFHIPKAFGWIEFQK